jgi:hypothetical protein
VVQPDRMADEFSREAVTVVRVRWLLHSAILLEAAAGRQLT